VHALSQGGLFSGAHFPLAIKLILDPSIIDFDFRITFPSRIVE
jgi:hypothetical protein